MRTASGGTAGSALCWPPRAGRLQEERRAGGLPGRAGRAARHQRLRARLGHASARHHRRGQVEGLGRDPSAQRRNRPARQARRAAGARSTRATPATRWRRPRPTSTWPRPSSPTPRRRRTAPTSCTSRSRSPSRSTSSRLLDFADAKSAVVNAQVSVDNAKIQLEDTDVRAPITGTVIEKDVERGTVIASATNNVSGGTTLLKMADLNLVQVKTLVDETDIGKIKVGLPATHHGGRLPQPAVRGRRAQDRAPGGHRAERHDVPGAGAHRQPRRLCCGRA